jgi:hypothetical protein
LSENIKDRKAEVSQHGHGDLSVIKAGEFRDDDPRIDDADGSSLLASSRQSEGMGMARFYRIHSREQRSILLSLFVRRG